MIEGAEARSDIRRHGRYNRNHRTRTVPAGRERESGPPDTPTMLNNRGARRESRLCAPFRLLDTSWRCCTRARDRTGGGRFRKCWRRNGLLDWHPPGGRPLCPLSFVWDARGGQGGRARGCLMHHSAHDLPVQASSRGGVRKEVVKELSLGGNGNGCILIDLAAEFKEVRQSVRSSPKAAMNAHGRRPPSTTRSGASAALPQEAYGNPRCPRLSPREPLEGFGWRGGSLRCADSASRLRDKECSLTLR